VTRALIPRTGKLSRAGAIQGVIREKIDETLRAIVEGLDEAVAATDFTIVKIDKAGAIGQFALISRCEVIVRNEVIIVSVEEKLLFESAVGTMDERVKFADFVRTRRALSSVAPGLIAAANGAKRK
jgi:hypothetical protein